MSVKITLVNYLNTWPFKFGIEKCADTLPWAEINYATPAECARMLISRQTNIALAPVAILAFDPQLHIITPFCLSTNRTVDSVKLYSVKPVEEIQSVVLDYQSVSSVSLLKILMRYYWKKEIHYVPGYEGYEKNMPADAMLVIGDRTFALNGKYPYEYDLATEWFRYYGKPFVFAAWISNISLTHQQIQELNNALEYGLTHLDEVIEDAIRHTDAWNFINKEQKKNTIHSYLKNNLHYYLDEPRQHSIQQFIHLIKTMETEIVFKV